MVFYCSTECPDVLQLGMTTALHQQERTCRGVINTAPHISGSPLPSLEDITSMQCLRRVRAIIANPTHPEQHLFTQMPSGRRYRCLKSRTSWLKNCFFPWVITSLTHRVHMLSVNKVNMDSIFLLKSFFFSIYSVLFYWEAL